jgi:hypothetical protein
VNGTEINSTIVGLYENKTYTVSYDIKTNRHWQTVFVLLQIQHNNHRRRVLLESDGKGNWKSDGKATDKYKGCIDVDIPVTPFTNSLPINRLKLKVKDASEVQVIYLDMLNNKISPVKQKYVRLSPSVYHYENIPNDFETDIQVDESNFVVDYPQLFVRTAELPSDFPFA